MSEADTESITAFAMIGGVERKINQVNTYVEYNGGNVLGQTADEIFYGARADKLLDKVIQLTMDKIAIDVANGLPVELPTINKPVISSFSGDNNVERARNAEIFYANEAARISNDAKKWQYHYLDY